MMDTAVVRKVFNLSHGEQKPIFPQTPHNFVRDAFPTRKLRSSPSSLVCGHSHSFKNVETFNLNPGYRLSRSAGKIYVSIQEKDPVPVQKPAPRKFSVEEMESLISDLREQIDLLSTYLQEERLRHAGTKKRAVVDLVQQKDELKKKHEEEMMKIREYHEEEKQLLLAQQDARLQQVEKEHDEKMEKLQSEYRMLQASFKIYRSTVQDEMQNELKLKKAEFEWEKKQCVDNAVDECRKTMEGNFSQEREEIRKEFLKNMNELMSEHRMELDRMFEKTKSPEEINELIKQSEQLTVAKKDIEKLKRELQESAKKNRSLMEELNVTKKKLTTLELQFDSKVQDVEDKHRSFIETLRREKADLTRRLVRSCEDFQVEKMARETAEKQRKEAAIKMLQKNLQNIDQKNSKLNSSTESRKSLSLDNQIEEIADILQRFDRVHLPTVLSELSTQLRKLKKKQHFLSQSVPNLTDSKIRSEILRKLSRTSAASSKEKLDYSVDFFSLWDSEVFMNNVIEVVSDQARRELDSDRLRNKLTNVFFSNVKQHLDKIDLQEKVTETLSCDFDVEANLNDLKTRFCDMILNETKQACDLNVMKPCIGELVANEITPNFAKDNLKTELFTVVCTDDKLARFSINVQNAVTNVILSASSEFFQMVLAKGRAADALLHDFKLLSDPALKRIINGAISDKAMLQLINDALQQGGSFESLPQDSSNLIQHSDYLKDKEPMDSYLRQLSTDQKKISQTITNKNAVDCVAAEKHVPELDVEKQSLSFPDRVNKQSIQEMNQEKLLKLVISDAASQDAVIRLDNDALRSTFARIVAEEVKLFWNDSGFRRKMSEALLIDKKILFGGKRQSNTAVHDTKNRAKDDIKRKSNSAIHRYARKSYEKCDSEPLSQDLPPVRIKFEDSAKVAVPDNDLGRWRGTFLSRDDGARPPIIFDVEAYKALTANKPDSSNIAQKTPVLNSEAIARKTVETKVSCLEESPLPSLPNSTRSQSPSP